MMFLPFNQMMTWATNLIVDAFQDMFHAVAGLLVATPDVTALPQVQLLTARSVTVLDIVFVLAWLAAGVLTMVDGAGERARYTAKQLMPRLIVAFVLAHFSPLWMSRLLVLVNAMTSALIGSQPGRRGAFVAIRSQLAAGRGGMSALLFAVCAAVVAILFATVAFSFLARVAVLLIVAVTGPLVLAMHALPQTESLARLWWRTLLGTLVVPLLQGIVLQGGELVLMDPAAQRGLLGVPGSDVLNLMIVIALLAVAAKIPGLVSKTVLRGAGSPGRFGNRVVRVMVVQQGLRVLTGGMSTGARALVRSAAAVGGHR